MHADGERVGKGSEGELISPRAGAAHALEIRRELVRIEHGGEEGLLGAHVRHHGEAHGAVVLLRRVELLREGAELARPLCSAWTRGSEGRPRVQRWHAWARGDEGSAAEGWR